jgi:hypothetical protein
MPFKDDKKRQAYIREYMRKRRRGNDAPSPITNAAEEQLNRQIRDAWDRVNTAREAMHEADRKLANLTGELLKQHKALIEKYNALVDDYNELLDELDNEDGEDQPSP